MANIRSYMGMRPVMEEGVYIDEMALVTGDVHLGKNVSVWPGAVIRGDVNTIKIGDNTNVQDGAVLHVTSKTDKLPEGFALTIGEDVTIGHRAMVHGATIGNRVLIGMNSTILDGAVVEDDVVIAAGSVVAPGKKLEKGFLYMGIPAKQARPVSDEEKEHIAFNASHYVEVAAEYAKSAKEDEKSKEAKSSSKKGKADKKGKKKSKKKSKKK